MNQLLPLRYVAPGGAAGALVRWGVLETVDPGWATEAVLVMNVVGSVLLGFLVGRLHPRRRRGTSHPSMRRPPLTANQYLLLGTGFCGGLTTFSAWALRVASALDNGQIVLASAVAVTTAVTAVIGCGLGYRLGRR